jgi:hypothetical protein
MNNLGHVISWFAPAFALSSTPYTGPAVPDLGGMTPQQKYGEYCVGDMDSTAVPQANYSNSLVQAAARKLSRVSEMSYYFYGGPVSAYGLKKGQGFVDPPSSAPEGTTPRANAFLVLLCGEFRDRPTMIEAKLRWVSQMYKLPVSDQQPIDYSQNLWSQVSASSYRPYLEYSDALWNARKTRTGSLKVGKYNVDMPVDGQKVCETKFIIGERVAKRQGFYPEGEEGDFESALSAHDAALAEFAKANCSDADQADYYDFRGDSNFKPNSPESNGMIWYSSSVTGHCKGTDSAKDDKLSSDDCRTYFRKPFQARWNAARAGLATWLFRDKSVDTTFASEGAMVTIVPNLHPGDGPFEYIVNPAGGKLSSYLPNWDRESGWSSGTLGFNEVMSGNPGFAYERIRDAVNRHTDWYASAYDDGMGLSRDQAYSPFVASSYVMAASDGFTAPGTTVSSPSDGRKHWMFVFRIKGSHWFNTQALASDKPVDFDKMWFDETSLGTNGLAKSEHAWDRLGTALEGEFDSILYLHNITTSGQVESDGVAW